VPALSLALALAQARPDKPASVDISRAAAQTQWRTKDETRDMSGTTLFDLGLRPPTTRTVANIVRRGGAAALDQAKRRAGEARYQEVTCRSALNSVKGMPFNWTLNPYRGCTHGCHYCFARRYQTQFELGPGDEFSSVIFVKVNFVDVLRKELDRPSWERPLVALGTATDPYQPIEGHYKLTRGSLLALRAARTPVGLVTKGPMVVRDADVLADIGGSAGATVYVSVPTVDEDAWAALEPGTAPPAQRLRAVRQLRDAGVDAGVLMSPVVPGFTTQPARLAATVQAVADSGAAFLGFNVMYLKGGTRDHFFAFLEQQFPAMVEGYRRLYPGAYAPAPYVATVRELLEGLRARHGLHGGTRRGAAAPSARGETTPLPARPDTAQAAFDWADAEEPVRP
jgi:DNA repair photolyase